MCVCLLFLKLFLKYIHKSFIISIIYHIQIPHVTCQNYLSRDLPKVEDCSKPNRLVCEDCSPWGEGRCWAKQDFKRYYASEYGLVNGTEAIMKEIYARGPIGQCKSFQGWIQQLPSSQWVKMRNPLSNTQKRLVLPDSTFDKGAKRRGTVSDPI